MDEMELMMDNATPPKYTDEELEGMAMLLATQGSVLEVVRQNEARIKQIEKANKDLKAKLLNAMEEYGVKRWEDDFMAISYIAPSTRVTLDSKALKEEMPEVFEEYKKVSTVKSSVRIKLK